MRNIEKSYASDVCLASRLDVHVSVAADRHILLSCLDIVTRLCRAIAFKAVGVVEDMDSGS